MALAFEVRLQLKVAVPDTGHVDGVWWPRSRVLTEQLSTLCDELLPRVGRVALVVYDVDSWDRPSVGDPDPAGGIRLEGSRSLDPETLIVVGVDGRRVVVRVVSPDAEAVDAEQAMAVGCLPDAGFHHEADQAAATALSDVTTKLTHLDGPLDDAQVALITGWVSEAARHFAHAPVQTFVPILVEHIVRDRLGGGTTAAS